MAVDVSYTVQAGATAYAGRLAAPVASLLAALDTLTGNLAAGSPVPAPSPSPIAPTTAGTRDTQPLLFQPVETALRPELYAGAGQWSPDADQGWGPTAKWVDYQAGWAWANLHGDYIDATLTAQGTTAWASAAAPQNVTAGATLDVTLDVTAALQNIQRNRRWCAFKLHGSAAPRSICTALHTNTAKRPSIDVTYAGGGAATLACRIVAADGNAGSSPQTTAQTIQVPVFIEFDQPALPVTAATMRLSVSDLNWSGTPNDIKVAGILTPPRNTQPMTGLSGAASESGYLDSGITSVSGILGAHRYVDTAAESDFLTVDLGKAFSSEVNYDPAIWGGASDTAKWPHTVAGKWLKTASFQSYSGPSFKTSAQLTAMGIPPLVDGLGAMVVDMPAISPLPTPGQEVGNGGRLAADLHLMFPEPTFGQGNRTLFVRYYEYIQLGVVTPALRIPILSSGAIRFTDMSGKTGIGPEHVTSNGGVGGTSGGGYGWQMRDGWLYNDAGIGGPDANADIRGFHLYDFQINNPVGHQYGSEQTGQWDRWGQNGGLGATVYVGRWVMIEKEITLNTINVGAGTYSADGALRAWVDGRLVSELTGMVFRTAPLDTAAYSPSRLRPCRELGHKGLWWNEFHGGQSENVVPRTVARTGLVWGTRRIGPMKLAPSWARNAASGTWSVVPMATTMYAARPAADPAINPNYPGDPEWGFNFANAVDAWCGAAFDEVMAVMWAGVHGGHGDYAGNEMMACDFLKEAPAWRIVRKPSGAIGNLLTTDDAQEATGLYRDGRPRSIHTANKWVHVPGVGPVLVALGPGAWVPARGGKNWSAFIDEATGEARFTAEIVPGSVVDNSAGCYDPVRNAIWVVVRNQYKAFKYTLPASGSPNTGVWTEHWHASNDNAFGTNSLCYVPGHDVILMATAYDDESVYQWRVLDPVDGRFYTPTFTGSLVGPPCAGIGQLRWVPSLGAACFWDNSSNTTLITKVTPGANPRTDPWTISQLPVSGSNTVTPSVRTTRGTFGRFAYSPMLGGFLLFNSVNGPTYFYKI